MPQVLRFLVVVVFTTLASQRGPLVYLIWQQTVPRSVLLSQEKTVTLGRNQKTKPLSLISVVLKRRNWENHGTDTVINSDGTFAVTAEFLGKSKPIRQGNVSPQQFQRLVGLVQSADPFSLKDEYKGPLKTKYSWWGYQLTIHTSEGCKSIRFHSEDDTVPEALHRVVEAVMAAAK